MRAPASPISRSSTKHLTLLELPCVNYWILRLYDYKINPPFQIMESTSEGTPPLKKASDKEDDWQVFVSGVPECSGVQNASTFDCLRSASPEMIFDAANSAIQEAQKIALFSPVIDGAGGVVPDFPSRLLTRGEFARIPFIAGTNLDEGES